MSAAARSAARRGTTPSTLVAGQTSLNFSGITIPANGSCTVTFGVTSSTIGGQSNTTSGVTTTQTPSAGTASNTATLTVAPLIAVPTLSERAMAVLTALMILAALVVLRRRQGHRV
jgi:hypothetical protein